jgi:lipopolysaccharide export LptBFGC system permease protein LptF
VRRPPWTLWLSTFGDLAKLTVLSGAVLVTIIAMGAAIKPLSDGALEASDALTFVALAILPMLAYVLPFAAGFASTLVYHRLSSTNEATAAYAGGISHRVVLAPALAMGLLLAGVLGVLNEVAIPRMLREMASLITVDITRMLAQQVERGKAVRLDDRTLVFADRSARVTPDPSSDALEQVVFTNFVAIRLDGAGRPAQEVTSKSATLWLFPPQASGEASTPDQRPTEASLVVLQMDGVIAGDDLGVGGFRDSSQVVFRVPNIFWDSPKFLSWDRLHALRRTPEILNWLDMQRKSLAMEAARVEVWGMIGDALRREGRVTLLDARGAAVEVLGTALEPRADGSRVAPVPSIGGVFVRHARAGAQGDVALETLADEAFLRPVAANDPRGERRVVFTLELSNARTREGLRDFASVPSRTSTTLAGLVLAMRQGEERPETARLATPSIELLRQTQPLAESQGPDAPVARAHKTLRESVARVHRDVLSKRNERFSMAASCLVITLTGAGAALLLSQRMPLTTYLWTFFPGLVCTATISGGGQFTKQLGGPGLMLMWSGVALLLAYTLFTYYRLRKH